MNPRVYVIVHVSRSCEIIFQNGGCNNFPSNPNFKITAFLLLFLPYYI